MNGKRAFLMFGFWVLVWIVFWHGAVRIPAVKRAADKGESPAASGALVVV